MVRHNTSRLNEAQRAMDYAFKASGHDGVLGGKDGGLDPVDGDYLFLTSHVQGESLVISLENGKRSHVRGVQGGPMRVDLEECMSGM